MATMKIKTPTKSWDIKENVKFNDVISKEVTSRVARVVLPKLAITLQREIDRQISIVATFFQRVVARTPIDEEYKRSDKMIKDKKTGRLKPDVHIPDKSVCQDDWYITDGKTKITAKQMKAVDEKMFWNVNDKYSVNEIKQIIKEKFNVTNKTEFVIGNNNDHFKTLEEGCENWKRDGISAHKTIGSKKGLKRDHGVKNKHSIQAPVGMWRITMAELEVMKNSAATSPLSSRYRAQYGRIMNGVPNDKKLAEFSRLLESRGNIAYKDIVRYLEKY